MVLLITSNDAKKYQCTEEISHTVRLKSPRDRGLSLKFIEVMQGWKHCTYAFSIRPLVSSILYMNYYKLDFELGVI